MPVSGPNPSHPAMRPALFLLALVLPAAAAPLAIRSSTPAANWEHDAYPVGNGRLGAMVFGGTAGERIQFNVDSLWSGGENESGGYDVNQFGSYQSFGDLFVEFDGMAAAGAVSGYSRLLDLDRGVVTTTFVAGGVTHTREVFASQPQQVVVVRFRADKPGNLTGKMRLVDPRKAATVATDDGLCFAGALGNGLRYCARVVVAASGGKADKSGDSYRFEGCDELVILLAAATDYAMDDAKHWRSGVDPRQTVDAQLAAACKLAWPAMLDKHLADHRGLFRRVTVDWGTTPEAIASQDTPARLALYQKGGADPDLEETLFQFGRYLLMGSSRPGTLPANLQGIWADGLAPPWFSDYNTNINIQMNYWLAEPANLGECHTPLFDWTTACIPAAVRATRKAFGNDTPGWTMRTSVNVFGGNGWEWNLPSSAWLAQHFWEHFAFSRDQRFLKDQAWPVLRGVSEFWLARLVEKDGKLLVPNGWSPEHGPREDGVTHDQELVWDLFTNTLAAGRVLDEDAGFLAKVRGAREKLLGPKIGSWGQLMEWATERPPLEKSDHRHTSHLFAVYPGTQISTTGTPNLAKAAAVSLQARGLSGDAHRSWTWPWRAAMWARLGNAAKAREMLRGLLTHNTLPNLFTNHPPFQMDGNFGITAGICEMLLQSHADEIAILPALPEEWHDGTVTGLRARGGMTVDLAWRDGKFASATLRATSSRTWQLRLPDGTTRKVETTAGQPLEIRP